MSCEPFVRYRARLTALASEHAAQAALGRATSLWRTPPSRSHWTAIFGRFYPDESPYAVQVFESFDGGVQRIARVESFESRSTDPSDDELWTTDAVIGFVRVTPIAADRDLATLQSVLDDGAPLTVVKYHPGLRCTVRGVRNGCEVFGKVFRDDRGRDLYDDYDRLWKASAAGELRFGVARPIAWDQVNRTLWQEALPGCAVRPRLRTREARTVARRIGEALGSLAQSQVPPRRVGGFRAESERAQRHAAELVRRAPSLADQVQRFTARFVTPQGARDVRPHRPIHGAPRAGQWLATSARLALVDFDRFAAGDPELDVGVLLADLDFEGLPIDTVDAIAGAVVEGWKATAGPIDHHLVDVSRAQQHLDKALKRASAVRPDADLRASASLRHSVAWLARAVT